MLRDFRDHLTDSEAVYFCGCVCFLKVSFAGDMGAAKATHTHLASKAKTC
jgi:hypothetical protein